MGRDERIDKTEKDFTVSKFHLLGIASWLGSGVLFLFQVLSTLVNPPDAHYHWEKLAMDNLLSPVQLEWIDAIPIAPIRHMADIVIHTQLIFVLLILGLVLFLIGSLFSKA